MNDQHFWIGRNKDDRVVEKSSSGGIMSAVAKWIFEHNGVVFGASYTEHCRKVKHIKVECYEELYKLRKSKYVWSDYVECFEDIKEHLYAGIPVLFIGTPCQCVAVKHRFEEFSNLYLLDFFCHGTLESQYYTSYIEGVQKKIKSVDFRGEADSGEHNFMFTVFDENGVKIISDTYDNNILTNLFVSSAGIRKACFNCKICCDKHISNVTMGDVEFENMAHRHGFDSKNHLSIISINDEVGSEIFDACCQNIKYSKLDERDAEEIAFYYRPHKNSGKPWEYNYSLRCWFEDTVKRYGFMEAAYRCKYYKDIQQLEKYSSLYGNKNIYLYGCGKKGSIIKELIQKYFSQLKIQGYIVTKKTVDEKNDLPVYEISQLHIDIERDFIIVAVEIKKDIYDLLENIGLKEGINYI